MYDKNIKNKILFIVQKIIEIKKKMLIFLAFFYVSNCVLVDFDFPNGENSVFFCPIEELIKTNAIVRCTNSAFDGSVCTHNCIGSSKLTDNFGEQATGRDTCICKNRDCQ